MNEAQFDGGEVNESKEQAQPLSVNVSPESSPLEITRELTPAELKTVPQVALVAHNADSLVLIKDAEKYGATDIELDLRFSREPHPWSKHRLSVRHGQLPVPFKEYPTPTQLIEQIDPDKRIVLDLKFLPKIPMEGRSTRTMLTQLRELLSSLEEQGRTNVAITGGNEELLNYLAGRYPNVELRWTIWTEGGYRRLMDKYKDKVKAVAIRAKVLRELGIEAFKDKKVYVFRADENEEDYFTKMGVAGIGTDKYKRPEEEE
jgi:hypothetical protein